jgi:hypothetical protein
LGAAPCAATHSGAPLAKTRQVQTLNQAWASGLAASRGEQRIATEFCMTKILTSRGEDRDLSDKSDVKK